MSTITFELKESRDLPEDHRDYKYLYYQDWYYLTIEIGEDWILDTETDGYQQIFTLAVDVSKSTSVRTVNGKLIDENIDDDYFEFTLPDPGTNRIATVVAELNKHIAEHTWVEKLTALI